jgi:hypothetical protein
VGCQLVGRWRIVDADLWDRVYFDLDGRVAGTEGTGPGCESTRLID